MFRERDNLIIISCVDFFYEGGGLTIGVGLLVKGILLLNPVCGNEFVGINLSLLHTVTTS